MIICEQARRFLYDKELNEMCGFSEEEGQLGNLRKDEGTVQELLQVVSKLGGRMFVSFGDNLDGYEIMLPGRKYENYDRLPQKDKISKNFERWLLE